MHSIDFRGVKVPRVGLGTWNMRGEACRRAVGTALSMGYRHIDTAELYQNEVEVGEAIAKSAVDREKVFLTTKVWTNHLTGDNLVRACHQSLKKLGGTYIDLYLIHAPNPRVPLEETMGAMNQLLERGIIRHVGVSNFSISQMKEARGYGRQPIFTNQIKYHPLHTQDKIVQFCQAEDILITAYSPLAKGRVLRSGGLRRIADHHGVTPAQVALRWLVEQKLVITIPKASNPDHLRENLDIFGFSLSKQEREEIRELRN